MSAERADKFLGMLKDALAFHVSTGGCDEEHCGCSGSQLRHIIEELESLATKERNRDEPLSR